MPTTPNLKRILILSKDRELQDSIQAIIKNQADMLLVEFKTEKKALMPEIAKLSPDVILLDYEYQKKGIFDLVDKIATEFQGAALVVVLPESEMSNTDRIILSGARAFLIHPFKEENLLNTIRRVMELMTRNQLLPQMTVEDSIERPKNTFTVFSPKGGAGTTTVAINLAIALHQQLKEDVLVIDGKHLFGHVGLCLNLRTGNSITDLLAHIGLLDSHMIRQVAVRHLSGIYVLPSPASISAAQGIRPEDVYKMMQTVQNVFPNIIIDGGSYLSEDTITYMDSSDRIILVLNPDLASIRDVHQFMDIAKSLSYPPEKTIIILNLTGRKADVRREEIEEILKIKIFGRIPADENLALSCLNEGVPIILKKPGHAISVSFREIAKEIVKVLQQNQVEYSKKTRTASAEELLKSSKLG